MPVPRLLLRRCGGMVIKFRNSPIKFKSLASKIAAGFLVLLVGTLVTVGLSFNSLIRDYLLQDTQESLLIEAHNMARMLSGSPINSPGPWGSLQAERRLFRMSSRLVEGQYIITDSHLSVVDSSMKETYPYGSRLEGAIADKIANQGLEQGKSLRFSTRDSVVVAVPVTDRLTSEIKGMVILLTSLENLRIISGRIVRLLLLILGMAGIFGIILSVVLARGITKPLRILGSNIRGIAARDFSGRVEIDTGDEIEELGEAFNLMADRLEEYDAAQQRLIQNLSHELKTPLMSIQGYAEAIRDGVVGTKEEDKSLGVIIRESQRLKNLVEDIIYLSKVESFEEECKFARTELEEIIHEAVETTAGISKRKNIKLNFDYDSTTSVNADGEKLLRVMVNLLSNAIRHASSEVWIEAARQGNRVFISVEDDGSGFTQRDLELLFERFYKGNGQGSGLGMTIAKAIVQAHGGEIRVSNGTKGARVEIVLPVLD